jgi:hypothetical protein
MVAFRLRVSMSPLRRPDEIQRLAARTREDTSKSHEDCGAPIGRDPSRDKGSLSAPRIALKRRHASAPPETLRRYFRPRRRPTCGASAHRSDAPKISTRRVPGRAAGERRTPEAGRYAAGGVRACISRSDSGPSRPPAPQAPRPKSREADGLQLASSWTRDACIVMQMREAGISWSDFFLPLKGGGGRAHLMRHHTAIQIRRQRRAARRQHQGHAAVLTWMSRSAEARSRRKSSAVSTSLSIAAKATRLPSRLATVSASA